METRQAGGGTRSAGKTVGSVANAARILAMLADTKQLRVSDVSERLGVSLSTAHRILSTLEQVEFLYQDPVNRCYTVGSGLSGLADSLAGNADLVSFARPLIAQLAKQVGETANLMVLRGSDVVFLISEEGPRQLRVGSREGVCLPAHCVSAGKALLARIPEIELIKLLPEELSRMTDKSITARADLLAELTRVRAAGYGTNLGESEVDVSGVGAAVSTEGGESLLGVAIAAPTARLGANDVREAAHAVVATAKLIAQRLPPSGPVSRYQ